MFSKTGQYFAVKPLLNHVKGGKTQRRHEHSSIWTHFFFPFAMLFIVNIFVRSILKILVNLKYQHKPFFALLVCNLVGTAIIKL